MADSDNLFNDNPQSNMREVLVEISPDRMLATVLLRSINEDEYLTYSFDEVMDRLADAGVKTGIEEDKIHNLVDNKIYDKKFSVACGRFAEQGDNGYYDFFFNTETNRDNKPVIREDGTVDYFNIQMFQKVNAGDKLVEYHEPTKGNFGYDVCGKLLVPKPGKPCPKIHGKGFSTSEDGREYFAAIDGKIEYSNFDLVISNVYEVNGDVDLSVGNIDFNGDVSIKGGVRSGVTVHAMGDIYIGGYVEGASIISGKNIIMRDGVNAKNTGKIEAEGTISAKFFENVNVFAKGDIKCGYMLNSNVLSYGKVIVEGIHGSIIGGDITGVMGVETTSCGHTTDTKTVVRVGSTKELRREYADYIMKLRDITTQIETFDQALAKYNALKDVSSEKYDQDMYTRVFQSKIVKKAEKGKLEDKSRNLFNLIRDSENAVVKVLKNLYPGTRVVMEDKTYMPESVFAHVIVKRTSNAIVLRDYDDN